MIASSTHIISYIYTKNIFIYLYVFTIHTHKYICAKRENLFLYACFLFTLLLFVLSKCVCIVVD